MADLKKLKFKTIKLSQVKDGTILSKTASAMLSFHEEYCCYIGKERVRIIRDEQ